LNNIIECFRNLSYKWDKVRSYKITSTYVRIYTVSILYHVND